MMFIKLICDPAKNQKNIETRALPLLVAVFCYAADDVIRIISLRKANAREQKKFNALSQD